MKNECKIIQDILPLYVEDVASDETKAFVDEHLADCEDCRNMLYCMKQPPEMSIGLSTAPLVHLKKKLLKKRIATVLFTAAVVLTIAITVFAFLTSPQYVPYSSDVLTLFDEGGIVLCTFDDQVTGFYVNHYISEDGATGVFSITAWNTIWDLHFVKQSKQSVAIVLSDGRQSFKQAAIYYQNNDGTEDVLLFGSDPHGSNGIITLPRLVLGYYLVAAVLACLALSASLMIFSKKQRVKIWIERILLYPISYILSHFLVMCVQGLFTVTYSTERNFLLILLVSTIVYLACLSGTHLYRARKEGKSE